MMLQDLIDNLGAYADATGDEEMAATLHKAAETIRLLWEVARESEFEKYRMAIDELKGSGGRYAMPDVRERKEQVQE